MSKKPLILDYYHFKKSIHSSYIDNPTKNFKLKCKTCQTHISASVKVTSNWITHLKITHDDEYNEYLEKKDKEKLTKRRKNKPKLINTPDSDSNIEQKSISKKYTLHHPMQKKLEKILIQLIAKSNVSICTIKWSEFRNFVETLNPQFRLCSRLRLKNTLIPDTYDQIKSKIMKELSLANNVNVTVDAWTDGSNKSYFAITAHFINNKWEKKSYLLHCELFYEPNTSEKAANVFKNVIDS